MSDKSESAPRSDHAELRGKVVIAKSVLRSPTSGRECVYWDVRDRWEAQPKERGLADFWLETADGKVLVLGDHVQVDARADHSRRIVEAVEGDLVALGERLGDIKRTLRSVQGPEAAKLQRERQELAKLATFLHATKAHAKDRVHVGRSKSEQAKWLESNAHVAKADGLGMRTAKLTRDAWEVVIEPGHEIIVNGRCSVELLPPEHGGDGGYRAASSGRVLRGTSAAPLLITGVGIISPAANNSSPERASVEARRSQRRWGRLGDPEGRRRSLRAALIALAIVGGAVGLGVALELVSSR